MWKRRRRFTWRRAGVCRARKMRFMSEGGVVGMTSVAFDTDVHAAVFDLWCWWISAELGCSPMKLTFFDMGADVTKSSSTWRLIRDARRMGT